MFALRPRKARVATSRARALCRVSLAALAGLLAVAPLSSAADRSDIAASPLIGVNYAHYAVYGCDANSTGILASSSPSVRALVRRQLAAMRAAGIETLRLFIWHAHDPRVIAPAAFVVPSAGGHLSEPYRGSLINYLSAARDAGYKSMLVVFGPAWTNDPIGVYAQYDPSLYGENWSFIQDVRALVKEHWPLARFDLLNEGAPSDYMETKGQVEDYIARLYRDYVDAFGHDDVTISSIAKFPADWTRLPNLIEALRASGRPLPTFFEVHPAFGEDDALQGLRASDATLSANGLTQPLSIGEGPYNSVGFARAVKRFIDSSSRPVSDVIEWPLTADLRCDNFSVSPPYRANAYIATIKGEKPSSILQASVTRRRAPRLRTPYGSGVTALEAGRYRLVVMDNTRVGNFHLTGPSINKKSGLRFRGSVVWSVKLRAGTYTFRSDGAPPSARKSFTVLVSE